MAENLTLITSFFRDGPHLMRNMANVRNFNPTGNYEWIVVDNSSSEWDFGSVKDIKFTLYKGINEKILKPLFLKGVSGVNAVSVDFGITKSHTRFICVLDPDFFVVYPNWIDTVIGYMREAGVGILSAPYHPTWYDKAHLATGHFMVIDTQYVPKELLSFAPSLRDLQIPERPNWLGKRRNIKRFRDCGSQIEELFGYEMEYLIPLYDHSANPRISKFDRALDRMLPKHYRLTNIDYPVINARVLGPISDAETYYWRGYPFAIHLRRFGQLMLGKDLKLIDNSIENILTQIYIGYRDILEAQ